MHDKVRICRSPVRSLTKEHHSARQMCRFAGQRYVRSRKRHNSARQPCRLQVSGTFSHERDTHHMTNVQFCRSAVRSQMEETQQRATNMEEAVCSHDRCAGQQCTLNERDTTAWDKCADFACLSAVAWSRRDTMAQDKRKTGAPAVRSQGATRKHRPHGLSMASACSRPGASETSSVSGLRGAAQTAASKVTRTWPRRGTETAATILALQCAAKPCSARPVTLTRTWQRTTRGPAVCGAEPCSVRPPGTDPLRFIPETPQALAAVASAAAAPCAQGKP